MSTKNIKKIDSINNKINDFRKYFTNRYDEANRGHSAYIESLVDRFYAKPSNANKIYKGKENSEFDMNTSTILAPYLMQWEELINEYKKLTGQEYKKPILYNAGKEAALLANQAEKAAAREARDALIAQKEVEKAKAKPAAKPAAKAKPVNKAKQELLKQYNMTEKEYDEMVNAAFKKNPTKYDTSKDEMYKKSLVQNKLEEVILPNATVSLIKKGVFSDMKDLINTIIENERKIEGMQPFYPEKNNNKDRTGKLMSDEEIAQLKSIREKLKKIPENVIIAPIEIKEEVKRKRGRPIVEGSKRQAKLAAPKPEAKRRGRPPKKVTVEETKEETKQEESKEDIAPKRKRGRPVVKDSKRQQALAAPVVKRPRGRPKKEAAEPAPKARAGRPSKCDSIPPKSDVKRPMTQLAPVISRFEIEDNKIKLKSNESVNPDLLKYNKLTPQLFFTVMEGLPVRLSDEITTFYDKKTTRERMSYVFKLVCSYVIAKGLSTAHDIEVALVTRIAGELENEPKKLKAFIGFVKKNCIAKSPTQEIKKAVSKAKATKEYPLSKLTAFNDTQYDLTKDSFIDIIKNTFIGKQASIRKAGTNYERVDVDEEGTKEYAELSQTLLAKSIINNLLEAAEDLKPALFEKLDAEYKADKASILKIVKEYLDSL